MVRCTALFRTAVVALLSLAASIVAGGQSVAANSQLTVNLSGSGAGTVFADSGPINCPGVCNGMYADGTLITLTAIPSGGGQFTGWLGPCTGTGSCSFTLNGATTVTATFAAAHLTTAALDVDGNSSCDALSDGLLAIRYLLGVSGPPLAAGATGIGAARNATEIAGHLADIRPLLDIDGNGQVDAATDGLLATRHMFGATLPALTQNAMGSNPSRTPEDIGPYLQGLCAPPLPPCVNLPLANAGCEFYAVALSNSQLDRSQFSFAVALQNTWSSTATVTISGGGLVSPSMVSIPAGAQQTVLLPWVDGLQTTTATVLQADGAYRIVSDRPLVAWQYNPLQYTAAAAALSYSNEASLLLPVAALTGNYRVVAWPSFNTSPALFAIVGTQDDTQVDVTPTATIVPGGGLTATAGMTGTVNLNRGDVIQVEMPVPGTMTYGSDPSGSLIAANKPVAVFGAHDASWIPASTDSADHLEEQLPPAETAGIDMIVPRLLSPAGVARTQQVRLVGLHAATQLTFAPSQAGVSSIIGPGEVITFQSNVNLRVTASQPLLVARYMEGGSGGSALGDPAMGMVVPFSQFRDAYTFVAPTNYQTSRLAIVAPTGAKVVLDGTTLAPGSFGTVGSSGYGVADVLLSNAGNGVHRVISSKPVGIHVYGYGSYTSYLVPGGTNLTR